MRQQISKPTLGLDLIEFQKARQFYRRHKDSLNSFFNADEINYIQKSGKPAEALAVLLASKEAVFKALPNKNAGIAAFRNIAIKPGKKDRVSYPGLELKVMKDKKFVVVHALGSDRKI